MQSTTRSQPSADSLPANLFASSPPDPENDRYPNEGSSVSKRVFISLVRFLIIFGLGVSATLALQSYGDREKSVSSYPQISGSAPQAEPVLQNAPDVIGLTSRQQDTNLLDLAAVRQSIYQIAASIASSQAHTDRVTTTQEQIARSLDRMVTAQEQMARTVDRMATSQEQITRSVDQLTSGQEQMTREITKLQEIEQSIRSKNSQPSPRPVSASAPKPVSSPVSASAPKPVSRASQDPTAP
jgi:hypothetical protein